MFLHPQYYTSGMTDFLFPDPSKHRHGRGAQLPSLLLLSQSLWAVTTLHPLRKRCAYHFTFYPIPEVSLLASSRLPDPLPVDFMEPLMPPLLIVVYYGAKLPFSGIFSQLLEVLLPGSCLQFGSNKVTNILDSKMQID